MSRRYDASGNMAPARESKYRRSRRPMSLWALLIGLALGLGSGLFYAWQVDPRIEVNTEPWQLNEAARADYMAAIALQYAYDGDLGAAVNRLLDMRSPGDPIQAMADMACKLATTSYVDNTSGQRAVRAMMTLYQLQGRSGCADNLLVADDRAPTQVVIDAATPTLVPPASKTPTEPPSATRTPTPPSPIIIPTLQPQTSYVQVNVGTFCSTEFSGIIEVRVQDFNGNGVPGERIRARWDGGESIFVTGLKPERGNDYADFEMEEGKSYTIEVLDGSDPSQPLEARRCPTDRGETALISYRIYFREQ